MRTKTKIWLIIASILILIGSAVFTIAFACADWNFYNLDTNKFQTNTYELTEDFDSININSDTADISFVLSAERKVVCYEKDYEKHTVNTQNGILNINVANNKKLTDYIRLNIKPPKITLYLTKADYSSLSISEKTGDINISKDFNFENVTISLSTGNVEFKSNCKTLKISSSTGDINVKDISCDNIELTASTGEIYLKNIVAAKDILIETSTGDIDITNTACNNLTAKASTGDITLNNVIAQKNFNLKTSTGEIEFELCDASEIYISTTTGDVEGELLTPKTFLTDTTTGDIDVPSTSGGKCQITTTTGDIEINIVKI